jgi:putative dehydrogenase
MQCATVPAGFIKSLGERLSAAGHPLLDAPMSGGAARAKDGQLTIMSSGSADAYARAEPILEAVAGKVYRLGDAPGVGSLVKTVNQLLAGVHIAATAEAMALGLKAGVDTDLMIKAIASGSGGSTQFGIRAPWMAQRKFHPVQGQAALLFHYFHMIEQWADETGTATPLLDRAIELYQKCVDMGLGESHDVAVMIDVINSLPRK